MDLRLSAPRITSISSAPLTNSVEVTVTFEQGAIPAGMLTCSAFSRGASITSVSQIQVAGRSRSFGSNTVTVFVSVTQLTALTAFDGYCVVQTESGAINTLSEALGTKFAFTTACCKSVAFVNAPSTIFADKSSYVNSKATDYTFTYRLLASPGASVTVIPVVFDSTSTLVSASTLRPSPSSLTFSTGSRRLTGRFVLQGSSSLSGVFIVELNYTGPARQEYFTISKSVQVVAATVVNSVSVPSLLACTLTNSGRAAVMQFDQPTDLAGIITQPFICSMLFEFPGDSVTSCTWLNNTFVRASFPSRGVSSNLMVVGSTVSVLGNRLKALCSAGINCASLQFSPFQSVLANAPIVPVVPKIFLELPTFIAPCDNVTIDASQSIGSGGRDWVNVTWSVTATSGPTASLLSVLLSVGVDLYSPITIPRSFIGDGEYTFVLTVKNYLGQRGTVIATFTYGTNINSPSLRIVGDSSTTIKSSEVLTIYTSAKVSSCATSNVIIYDFQVLLNGVVDESIVFTSNDPQVLIVPAFSFVPSNVYSVVVTATVPSTTTTEVAVSSARATVSIAKGDVHATISGGSYRSIPVDRSFTVDASSSFDDDKLFFNSSDKSLTFEWSCVLTSLPNFGEDCSSIINNTLQSSVLSFAANTLEVENIYSLELQVVAADGRFDTASVDVEVLAVSNAATEILGTLESFNAESELSLFGLVQADFDVEIKWQAFLDSVAIPFEQLSTSAANLSFSVVSNALSYPMVVGPDSFTAGSKVTFRLSATPLIASSTLRGSFAEITLLVNVPPSGGGLAVSPLSGVERTTIFTILSSSWVTDDDNLPLTYDFSLQLLDTQPNLPLMRRSTSNSVSSTLPAGLESSGFQVLLISNVYDVVLATAAATTVATVSFGASDLTLYLTSNLAKSADTSNADFFFQTIGNAASSLNRVNCSLISASFCASLNREVCFATAHTCSGCLEGFQGVIGDANSLCTNSTSAREIGESCEVDRNCLLNACVAGVCIDPPLLCPTSSIDATKPCSSQGDCLYRDSSGNEIPDGCNLTDVYCSATCVCVDDFGGADCSLTRNELIIRDEQRTQMCSAILLSKSISNPSSDLLEKLISSLLVVYNPNEVLSTNGSSMCENALLAIIELAEEGYLVGTSQSTKTFLAEAVSSFVKVSTTVSSRRGLQSNESLNATVSANTTGEFLESIIGSLTNSLHLTMANGQSARNVIADNIQLTVRKDLVLNVQNITYLPPVSSGVSAYGSEQPTIEFVDGALASCDRGNGYAHIAVMQWRINPYPNSDNVRTPILLFSTTPSGGASARRTLDETQIELLSKPAFFLTFPFTQEQRFNLSITDFSDKSRNFTFPDCTLFDGSSYKACTGCNVSSYSNTNVSFACSDISLVCPTSSQRNLDRGVVERKLQLSDDITDDDYAENTVLDQPLASQFGALLVAAKAELFDVLSTNPFALNIEKSLAIIIAVGLLGLISYGGLVYFALWDKHDKAILLYAKLDSDKAKEVMLKRRKLRNISKKLHNQRKLEKLLQSDKRSIKHSLSITKARWILMRNKTATDFDGFDPAIDNNATALPVNNSNSDAAALIKTLDSEYSNGENFSLKVASDKKSKVAETVAHFLRRVLPADSLIGKYSPLKKYMDALYEEHDFTSFVASPSMSRTRAVRWMNAMMGLMSQLFIDTLFFGIFFPNDGSCESRTARDECLADTNTATGGTYCTFENGKCTLQEPPPSVLYLMVISLLIVIFSIPLEVLYAQLLFRVCSRRPKLETAGLNDDIWLGRSSQNTITKAAKQESELKILFDEIEKEKSSAADAESKFEEKSIREKTDLNFIAETVYGDVVSPGEEVTLLLVKVKEFLRDYIATVRGDSAGSDSFGTNKNAYDVLSKHSTAQAIMRYLGIYPDGNPAPLTLWQKWK